MVTLKAGLEAPFQPLEAAVLPLSNPLWKMESAFLIQKKRDKSVSATPAARSECPRSREFPPLGKGGEICGTKKATALIVVSAAATMEMMAVVTAAIKEARTKGAAAQDTVSNGYDPNSITATAFLPYSIENGKCVIRSRGRESNYSVSLTCCPAN